MKPVYLSKSQASELATSASDTEVLFHGNTSFVLHQMIISQTRLVNNGDSRTINKSVDMVLMTILITKVDW